MKLVLILFIFLCFSSCSFDNKSGIWINENQNLKKEEKFSELETLISSKESFNEIVKLDKNFNFKNLDKFLIKINKNGKTNIFKK